MNHADDQDWKKRYTELTEAYEMSMAELDSVYQSRSWRLTAPLRNVLAARGRTQNAS